MTVALRRNFDVFPKRYIPSKVFSDPLNCTGQKVWVAKCPVRVGFTVYGDSPILTGALPRTGVGGGAFTEKTGRDGTGRKIPVSFNADEVSLIRFGEDCSIEMCFHTLHAKHPGWEHPGPDTIGG